MDSQVFAQVVLNSEAKIAEAANYPHKRYLFGEVRNTPKEYFAGIAGLRGIGKTVMMLQLARQMPKSLYFSSDAANLRGDGIYDVARMAKAKGYESLFIDEVHFKPDWKQDLKTLYDEGGMRVFFSGSSAIEVGKGADLSRRALIFRLKPSSFREYLAIKKGIAAQAAFGADELFDAKKRRALISKTSGLEAQMGEYYSLGGPLCPSVDTAYFYRSLETTLERIITVDLAHLRAVDARISEGVYSILRKIALSPPGETSYSSVASVTALSKPTVIQVIGDLVKIGLVNRIMPCGKAVVRKEPKLFLAFPFRSHLCRLSMMQPDAGAQREEFFASHADGLCYLSGGRGEKTPDFLFNGKRVEIGGAGKNFRQNPDFIFKDGITLEEKEIPLYLAGFLY